MDPVKKKKIIFWSINIGLITAVSVLAWIFGPSLFVEAKYQDQVKKQQSGKPTTGFSSLMYSIAGDEPGITQVITPASIEFGLVIPKIFANVTVTENVNPEVAEIYKKALREKGGVAHAAGTAVPGEPGAIYIFGHSTDTSFNVARFNAVFYLLKKLEKGDLIKAYYKGEEFDYIVTEKKMVDPTDITDITNVESKEKLILQTCWPPGTTWKRLLIIAEPKEI